MGTCFGGMAWTQTTLDLYLDSEILLLHNLDKFSLFSKFPQLQQRDKDTHHYPLKNLISFLLLVGVKIKVKEENSLRNAFPVTGVDYTNAVSLSVSSQRLR